MRKPLIGIVPLVDTEKRSYWMLPGYMDSYLQEAMMYPHQFIRAIHRKSAENAVSSVMRWKRNITSYHPMMFPVME